MKDKKIVGKNHRKKQTKSYLGGYDRFERDKTARRILKDKRSTMGVVVNYSMALRMIGNLAYCAENGVIAAAEALEDLAQKIKEIKTDPCPPGAEIFKTHEEWKRFLIDKIAEWVATPTQEQLEWWFNRPSEKQLKG